MFIIFFFFKKINSLFSLYLKNQQNQKKKKELVAREDFEAELRLMTKMQPHSNVVQYRGITELENGDLAVVMEFCSKVRLRFWYYFIFYLIIKQ